MPIRTNDFIKYTFSKDELREMGEDLAHEDQRLLSLRDEKKATTTEFTDQIKAAEKRIADLSGKIVAGFEMREVDLEGLFTEREST